MPRKQNPLRYVVFSSRAEYYDRLETIILNALRTIPGELILVKESGKKNDHPHLNLVYRDGVIKINRKWENIIATQDSELVKENPYLIKTKNVFDKEKLINGYLTKESGYEILYSRYITVGQTQTEKRHTKKIQQTLNTYIRYTQRMLCGEELDDAQEREYEKCERLLDSEFGASIS